MAREALNCWHCGAALESVPLPIGRRDPCPRCDASLHVCRQCAFFDRDASKMCREPMADEVTDKEAANFCDHFRPRGGLAGEDDREAVDSRARLDALFGGGKPAPGAKAPPSATAPPRAPSEADAARSKLDALFGESGAGDKKR